MGEATIEPFFDNGDRLVSVASNIQGVGVDAAAAAATTSDENKAAGTDGANIVNRIVAGTDLHDNKTVPLIGADLLAEARLEVRAEVDAVPIVVLGTVLETHTVGCAIPPRGEQGALRIEANVVRVDAALKGSVPSGEIYVDTAVRASQPESYVFRYYADFERGRQYFFFLTPEDVPAACGRSLYFRFMSARPTDRVAAKRFELAPARPAQGFAPSPSPERSRASARRSEAQINPEVPAGGPAGGEPPPAPIMGALDRRNGAFAEGEAE